jgi:hypothetical protein
MDQPSLNRLFPGTYRDNPEAVEAFNAIEAAGKDFAETLNRYLIESQQKNALLVQLFQMLLEAERAIRLDGVSNTQNMVVMVKQ